MTAGQFFRRWGVVLALACVALGSWQLAQRGDTDDAAIEPLVYNRALSSPMLSARRLPLTLQAPVVDAAIAPEIELASASSPPNSCLMIRSGNRQIGPDTNPATPLVPASNQKIVTTHVALEVLGPEFRFTTSVRSAADPEAGVVAGDLYLVGGGDPFLVTGDWMSQYTDLDGRTHTRLEELADRVVAAGVSRVAGGVVGDETLYDALRQGPWAERLVSSNQSGPLSALTVNEGFVDWPEVFADSTRLRSPTDNPPLHAASVFAQLLQERGVVIDGAPAAGSAPPGSELASIESPPLRDIVTHVNSFSSNIGAELLVKRLGLELRQEGAIRAGADAMLDHLTATGIPTDGLVVDDGSGLAESNRLTCQALAAILVRAGPQSPLGTSMSIGGIRGSLDERFTDTPAVGRVLGKTGTLNGVRALSGYVLSATEDGRALTFAYIANDEQLVGLETAVREVQDQLLATLTGYPGQPSVADLEPLATTPS